MNVRRLTVLAIVFASVLAGPVDVHASWRNFKYAHNPAQQFFSIPPEQPWANVSYSTERPRMGSTAQMKFSLRNGDLQVEDARVRVWHLPICRTRDGRPGDPSIWDYQGSTMIADVPLHVLAPQELVTGTVAFVVKEGNGFVFGGNENDLPQPNCNNVVTEFFSAHNNLRLWDPDGFNSLMHVDSFADQHPDYVVSSVFVNAKNPDREFIHVLKQFNTRVTFTIENRGALGTEPFQICFSPRNAVPVSLPRGYCETLDPIPAGGSVKKFFDFIPVQTQFSMSNFDLDNMFNIGVRNTAVIDINPYELTSEMSYENNEKLFSFFVNN